MADLLIEDHGTTRVITINRPHRRNAVDRATGDALYAAFQQFDRDAAVSVAILTGADGAFCAGFDLKSLAEDGETDTIGKVKNHGESTLAPTGSR